MSKPLSNIVVLFSKAKLTIMADLMPYHFSSSSHCATARICPFIWTFLFHHVESAHERWEVAPHGINFTARGLSGRPERMSESLEWLLLQSTLCVFNWFRLRTQKHTLSTKVEVAEFHRSLDSASQDLIPFAEMSASSHLESIHDSHLSLPATFLLNTPWFRRLDQFCYLAELPSKFFYLHGHQSPTKCNSEIQLPNVFLRSGDGRSSLHWNRVHDGILARTELQICLFMSSLPRPTLK